MPHPALQNAYDDLKPMFVKHTATEELRLHLGSEAEEESKKRKEDTDKELRIIHIASPIEAGKLIGRAHDPEQLSQVLELIDEEDLKVAFEQLAPYFALLEKIREAEYCCFYEPDRWAHL